MCPVMYTIKAEVTPRLLSWARRRLGVGPTLQKTRRVAPDRGRLGTRGQDANLPAGPEICPGALRPIWIPVSSGTPVEKMPLADFRAARQGRPEASPDLLDLPNDTLASSSGSGGTGSPRGRAIFHSSAVLVPGTRRRRWPATYGPRLISTAPDGGPPAGGDYCGKQMPTYDNRWQAVPVHIVGDHLIRSLLRQPVLEIERILESTTTLLFDRGSGEVKRHGRTDSQEAKHK